MKILPALCGAHKQTGSFRTAPLVGFAKRTDRTYRVRGSLRGHWIKRGVPVEAIYDVDAPALSHMEKKEANSKG